MLSRRAFFARQMACGSTPAGRYLRQDVDGDLDIARDAAIFGERVQLWKLHAMAQDASL